ncbi:hypothetical protein ECPV144_46240 [Escherichia coli]
MTRIFSVSLPVASASVVMTACIADTAPDTDEMSSSAAIADSAADRSRTEQA